MSGRILATVLGCLLAVSQVPVSRAANSVPVLIWGGSANSRPEPTAANPFKKTSQGEFVEILTAWTGPTKSPVVVLVENNLCSEDVTQQKEQLQTLTRGLAFQYIPAVDQPLAVLENFDGYNQTEDEDVDSMSDGQIAIQEVNNFDAVAEIFAAKQESNPNVIGVLTGRSCRFTRSERTKREVTPTASNTSHLLISTDRILLYCSQWPVLTLPDEEIQLTADNTVFSSNGSETKDDPLSLHLEVTKPKTSQKVSLNFVFVVEDADYHTLTHVNYSGPGSEGSKIMKTDRDIAFPFGFSYHCAQNVIFTYEEEDKEPNEAKEVITFNVKDMQVQVFSKSEEKVFADSYNCVGFTTIPIWTGIFVTAILGIIMIWALTMIIDIRTMDRFDDPKGKVVTISAQE